MMDHPPKTPLIEPTPTPNCRCRLGLAVVVMVALAALGPGCAGPSVDPIDIHNPTISAQSRRFVADAQDAVSIAKNGVEEAQRKLDETRARRQTILGSKAWKDVSGGGSAQIKKLLDARRQLAELRLQKARANQALAEAKLTEVYAETAVRHDLETYELEEIRQRVDQRLSELRQAKQAIASYLPKLDKVSRAWWKSYRALLAGNNHPDMFFVTAQVSSESPFHPRGGSSSGTDADDDTQPQASGADDQANSQDPGADDVGAKDTPDADDITHQLTP